MSDQSLPPHPTVHELTARMTRAMQAGEYQAALPLLDTLLIYDPANPDFAFSRALAHYQLRHYPAALTDFNRAVEQGADNADLYLMRGRTHALLQDSGAALSDLQRALDQQPSLAIYRTRAQLLTALGQLTPALADYDAALQLEADGRLYYERALLLTRIGETARALTDLEQAQAHNYHHPDVALQRGYLLQATDPDAAWQQYSAAIALDKRLTAGYQARAELALQREQFDDALADLNMLVKLLPDDADVRVLRGQALLLRGAAGDALQARREFGEVLRANPEQRLALCGRALAYMRLGKPERAEADLYAFVSAEATSNEEEQAGVAWLILALAQQGKRDEACQQIALMRDVYPALADSQAIAASEGWDETQRALYAGLWLD